MYISSRHDNGSEDNGSEDIGIGIGIGSLIYIQ